MRLTRFTHACVRLERGGQVLVIDPGTYSEATALSGAHAVLISHEHADHVDHQMVAAACRANSALKVYAHVAVVDQLSDSGIEAESIAVGDTFAAAGFEVRAVGGQHAEIVDGLPGCPNLGLLIDGGAVYHPGDSFFVPDQPVETLLAPVAGPWLKVGEAVTFARAVGPQRAFPIHDAALSPIGLAGVDQWMETAARTDYRRLESGESTEI